VTSLDLVSLLLPELTAQHHAYRASGKPFVHYTSIEAGCSILQRREFWLRNATCMNDWSEVNHGLQCLFNAFNDSDSGSRLKSLLDEIHPGMMNRFIEYFNNIITHLRYETYITCISEHDPNVDEIGRLSMWRAYGSNGGLAFVLRPFAFFNETDALESFTNPVNYVSESEFADRFSVVVNRIADNRQILESKTEQQLKDFLYFWFRWVAVCSKHPGFSEEREWRVIHSPTLFSSDLVRGEVESVRGLPQIVYKIRLEDVPDRNLINIEIPKILDHLIVGPTQFPYAVREAFARLLAEAGIADVHGRLRISNIPVR
jgi:hypothetical protein